MFVPLVSRTEKSRIGMEARMMGTANGKSLTTNFFCQTQLIWRNR